MCYRQIVLILHKPFWKTHGADALLDSFRNDAAFGLLIFPLGRDFDRETEQYRLKPDLHTIGSDSRSEMVVIRTAGNQLLKVSVRGVYAALKVFDFDKHES